MTTPEYDSSLSEQKKVLIFGVDSQIGNSLKDFLIKNGIEVFGTTRRKRNINKHTYFFDLEQPDFDVFTMEFDYIVFCAGHTAAACEKDIQKSRLVNVTGTIEAIDRLVSANSFVIYISSNHVFNGEKPFYKHTEKTCAVTVYGKFKSEVEDYLANKLYQKSAILRLTKVITEKTPFLEQWKIEAKEGRVIKTFKNRFLSPVQIDDVLENINLLLTQKRNGIFHFGGKEEISYTEYAKIFFKDSPLALKLIAAELDTNTDLSLTHNSLTTHLPTKEAQYNSLLDVDRVTMGLMSGHSFLGDTKRLVFTLSRYKFVSKMFSGFDNVLEIGCADAFGTPIVLNEVSSLVACDFDPVFIGDAKTTHPFSDRIQFQVHDMVKAPINRQFEGAFCLDVLEHIEPRHEDSFLTNICQSLRENGSLIVGMPSLESQIYASKISKLGHVNCKKGSDLKFVLSKYFQRVFLFSMNDEVVHTGYEPMSQYILALCCFPKK